MNCYFLLLFLLFVLLAGPHMCPKRKAATVQFSSTWGNGFIQSLAVRCGTGAFGSVQALNPATFWTKKERASQTAPGLWIYLRGCAYCRSAKMKLSIRELYSLWRRTEAEGDAPLSSGLSHFSPALSASFWIPEWRKRAGGAPSAFCGWWVQVAVFDLEDSCRPDWGQRLQM